MSAPSDRLTISTRRLSWRPSAVSLLAIGRLSPTPRAVMRPDAVALFERLMAALWRTHGTAIAHRHAGLGHETPRPPGARWAGRRRRLGPDDTW